MNENENFKMTPLDQMLSSESLQVLKAAVPYAPPSMQKFLSIWSKMQELRNAMNLFPQAPDMQAMSTADTPKPSAFDILSEVSQFAVGETKANLENMTSALAAMQMFQAMQNETELNKE